MIINAFSSSLFNNVVLIDFAEVLGKAICKKASRNYSVDNKVCDRIT